MTVVRSAVFNVFFFSWLIVVLLLMWIVLPMPRAALQQFVRVWARGMFAGLRLIAGLDIEIRGTENIRQGGAIYASKHQSAWDTAVFFLMFADPAYVLKKELLSIPLWGWYARKCESIAVDRAGGAQALKVVVRGAQRALSKGRAVIIFPEGTRTAPGARHPYHPGVAALYRGTTAPVIPVALNSGLFWGRRSFLKHSGTVIIEFLPPVPAGLDRKAFMAELERRIEEASDRLRIEAAGTPDSAANGGAPAAP